MPAQKAAPKATSDVIPSPEEVLPQANPPKPSPVVDQTGTPRPGNSPVIGPAEGVDLAAHDASAKQLLIRQEVGDPEVDLDHKTWIPGAVAYYDKHNNPVYYGEEGA